MRTSISIIRKAAKDAKSVERMVSRLVSGFIAGIVLLLLLVAVPVHISASPPTNSNLNGVVLSSQNNGWAVGGSGNIVHYDSTSWNIVPSGTASDLFGLSFGPVGSENANSGFAVGGSGGTGAAVYWGGAGWSVIATGLSGAQVLSSVFELSSTDAWAVDSVTGGIWHWSGVPNSGGGWSLVSTASAGLNSIFMLSSTDGWAVGTGGIIYRFTGGWTPYTNVGSTLNSVFMISSTEGWAVGDSGAIYHYLSGTWSGPVSPGTTSRFEIDLYGKSERGMGGGFPRALFFTIQVGLGYSNHRILRLQIRTSTRFTFQADRVGL